MTSLPPELRTLIEDGPLAHLTTINPDGGPHVNVIWIGLDGEEIISGHMSHKRLVRNMQRDPRVILSFDAPRDPTAFLNPYAVLRCTATVTPSDGTWDLLNRLTKTYMSPDSEFPAARKPGFITRYTIERISGVGPWATRPS